MIEFVVEWGQPGSLARAIKQVNATADIGATFAKWQIVNPDRLASNSATRYWDTDLGGSESQAEQFRLNGQLTPHEWGQVADACRTVGVEFMATPFDLEAVELLESLNVPAYKIASGDITYKPLVERVGKTCKRVFLSTGASTPAEIVRAVRWLRKCHVVPMACDLVYPCPLEASELSEQIAWLRLEGHREFGYSDHTLGVVAGAVAVTLGATVLEKHVTLDPDGGAPDDRMALTVKDAITYRTLAEQAATLLTPSGGDPEAAARVGARRSAHAARSLEPGNVLTADDVAWLRPCPDGSITPTQKIAGRTLLQPVTAGERITRDAIA